MHPDKLPGWFLFGLALVFCLIATGNSLLKFFFLATCAGVVFFWGRNERPGG